MFKSNTINMNLFEIINDNVEFSPQAIMLKPFKKLWDSDKTKGKTKSYSYMSYVYYMSDERSDFMHILDIDSRHDEVVKYIEMPKGFTGKEKDILNAIEFYQHMSNTTSTMLLQSTRLVLQKISSFLDNLDMNERDIKSNKPIHDIGKITASVEKVPKLIKAINEIEKEVVKEKELKAQTGSKTVAMFEQGIG